MQANDQEYWQSIQKGDKTAFEKVFRSYYQVLCNYAFPLMKDKDEAEEVVQNMFFNVWQKKENLQINTSIKSYLYRVVHNDCLNKIKHGKVRTLYAEDYKNSMNGGFDNGDKVLHAKELNKKINEAIDELPQQCGLVFKMSRFEGLKYNEIADELKISVKTVENHMGKALKILREKLKEYLPMLIWLFILNKN